MKSDEAPIKFTKLFGHPAFLQNKFPHVQHQIIGEWS
jgi:hypothetical protein